MLTTKKTNEITLYIKKAGIFFITIVLLYLNYSIAGPKRPIEERLQKVLDKGIKKYNVNGVSAAILFPNEKIWTGVSGISHDSVSMNPDMLYAIGSITKNVVAALTMKLVEENAISLNDPLSKWLPEYPYIDGNITIRQLLNHTSGIYMFWDNQQIWDALKEDRTKIWTPKDILNYIKEPYFAPGEGWHYSNTNYLLLAMIIEKVTGSTLSTEFKNRFWQPLGINNAYLSLQEELPENQAHVFGDNFNNDGSNIDLTFLPRASHESITYGSSGIFITAEDLARWCHSLFEGKVLSQQSMNEMLQFVKFRPVANMSAYGLGVQIYPKSFSYGKEAIGHGGANIGTSTYMVYLPDYHVSIVVMINAFPSQCIDVITKGLIKTVLKEQKAIRLIPYFDLFPTGFILICAAISITTIIIVRIKTKRKVLQN
ncbi:beta-lactamase family protein [candidate division KSB1 bacterium]|nr:beta-lactamase family protein [candidate division KSB1 bacterium]